MEIRDTRYARTPEGVYIAYQVAGEGPVDFVWGFDFSGNVDLAWEWPDTGALLRALARSCRLILHDRRGTGLSSRNVGLPNLETRVSDLRLVLDAVGSERPCSGLATVAAGRRWSLTGDRGGRIEVDSVWIHLDPDQRPARITHFDAYAEAAAGRRVSPRPQLADPPTDAPRSPWPLRASDVDLHGHVNNTVYWQAIEHALHGAGPEPKRPLRARVDFRDPLDLGDPKLADLQDVYSGSDGTRTRDLRRDRPARPQPPQPARTRNYGYSRHFLTERTGCDRLRPFTTRQGL
jgi:pimeloyl-ACP methyl ester carboxylesterase